MEVSDPNENKLRRWDLSEGGLSFAREELTKGGRLSRRLLTRKLESATALLPATIDRGKLSSLEFGGSGSTRDVWVADLNHILATLHSGIAIADAWTAEPSDAYIATKQHFTTEEGEVYYFASNDYPQSDDFVFRWASQYPSIAFISQTSVPIMPNQIVKRDELDFIAAKTQAIYIGIFDNETFMKVLLD